jgi:hypothetical protein
MVALLFFVHATVDHCWADDLLPWRRELLDTAKGKTFCLYLIVGGQQEFMVHPTTLHAGYWWSVVMPTMNVGSTIHKAAS